MSGGWTCRMWVSGDRLEVEKEAKEGGRTPAGDHLFCLLERSRVGCKEGPGACPLEDVPYRVPVFLLLGVQVAGNSNTR